MTKYAPVQVGSHTCTQNVEFSVVKNATFAAGTPQTTVGWVFVKLDLLTLVAGDSLEIREYHGVNGGTVTAVDAPFNAKFAQIYKIVPFFGGPAWDVTVKITTASSRSIGYEVYQDQGDVNVTTWLGTAVATPTVAGVPKVEVSTIVTDAITAASVKADAVTKIQTGLATSTALGTAQTGITDIGSRLPAALVSGRISSDVGSWLGTAAATPTVAGIPKVEVSSLAANSVTSSVLAANCIGASQIATDAIDADSLKTDAVTEIQTGLATSTALATLQTSATDVQSRLPAALVGGRIPSDVGSWLGTAAAAPTVAGVPRVEVASALAAAVTTIQSGLALAATAVSSVDFTPARAAKIDNLDAAVTTRAPLSTALSNATWTNARAALLDNLSLLDAAVSTRALSATALSTAQWSNARAAFLDSLNIAGLVASSAEATAIQNNTRVVRSVPDQIERPDSGTQAYRIELFLYDSVGNMEAPDSAPTVALVNASGTDLSARLDSATMALVSAGRYRVIYTASVADSLEQLLWVFSVVEGGATRQYGNSSLVCDTTSVDFTSADRTKLTTLAADLTTARAAKIDFLVAPAASQASVDSAAAGVADVQSRLPATLDSGNIRAAVHLASAGSITASAVAADAVDKIQAGLATSAAQTAAQTAIDDARARLPATLDSGSIRASVQLMAANTLTAGALASDAVAEIQAGLATTTALTAVNANVSAVGTAVLAVGAAVSVVNADTDDIQNRLPATLDAGNMRVSSPAGLDAAVAVAVLATVVETDANDVPVDVAGALRLLMSEAVASASGFVAGPVRYRDLANTKDRVVGAFTADGRGPITLDPA